MLKTIICCDSFKGFFTSIHAGKLIKKGLLNSYSSESINDSAGNFIIIPMADGGEGSLEAIAYSGLFKKKFMPSCNVWGTPLSCPVLFSIQPGRAFFQLSDICGFNTTHNSKVHTKTVMNGSTKGVGILIKQLIKQGIAHITIFCGGTSTCDGGMGVAKELGVTFLDKTNTPLLPCGLNMQFVDSISAPAAYLTDSIKITLALDVDNPLFGSKGAAHIFAPQKGATINEVGILDLGLKNLNKQVVKQFGKKADASNLSGAGAAGGILLMLNAIYDCKIRSGAEIIIKNNVLPYLDNTDIVITGEGRMDNQTLNGKAQFKIAQTIHEYNKKTVEPIRLVSINGCKGNGFETVLPFFDQTLFAEDYLDKQDTTNSSPTLEQAKKALIKAAENISNCHYQ